MIDRLQALEDRYDELGHLMSDPEVLADVSRLQKLAREHNELGPTVARFRELKKVDAEIADARGTLEDGADPEYKELAREILAEIQPKRDKLLEELKLALVPS